jgi:cytochrome P450
MLDLGAYVEGHAAHRRASTDPGDDLFSALVATTDDGDRLSNAELVAMIVNLLFGALDTTRGSLSMMVALLAQRPDLVAQLRSDRALLPAAVEELLSFEPPVGEISRVASEDVELHGIDVPEGALVAMSVLAANRDPRKFDRPDDVDLRRYADGRAPSLLSFGRGIHHCLGNALARLELRVALDEILERCARIDLEGFEPRYVPFLRVRCIESLPLRINVR